NAKQSIRQVAHQTGFSKSSVHRLKQAMERRDGYPESWVWETEEGQGWLLRLVVATLYISGLKRGVGAESISEFFCRLRLASHICSDSQTSRHLRTNIAPALLTFGENTPPVALTITENVLTFG